jgi:hypothetical protein
LATAVIEGQRGIREIAVPRARIPLTRLLIVLALSSPTAGLSIYLLISIRRDAVQRKAQFEKYLNPMPDELLKYVSPLYTPGWQKILVYTTMLTAVGAQLGLVGLALYTLLSQRLPTLPLDF